MDMRKIEDIRLWLGTDAPRPMYHLAVFFRKVYKRLKMPEQIRCFGSLYPDRTFYVIRIFPPGTGFLANYNYVLGYMKYAYDKGYIPIVDMENYGTLYQEKAPINGTNNVWEYFFLQPWDPINQRRYSLKEVYKSKNVILANGSMELCNFDGIKEEHKDVLRWQYEMSKMVPFNELTINYMNNVKEVSFPLDRNKLYLIGVPIRGAEQRTRKVYGHPIPASTDDILKRIIKCEKNWENEIRDRKIGIFVKAEEEESLNEIIGMYDKVYYTNAKRIVDYGNGKAASNIDFGKNSKYQSLLEYLTQIYLISDCDAIIGSFNNGLYCAIIWSQSKSNTKFSIIDKGVYK